MSWRRLPITRVDAFAERAFEGNPAAVMPLDEWMSDAMLQAIAAENNLSETAFVVPDETSEADYELRWFTPKQEVALCGHATLASGHVLLTTAQWRGDMRFRTRHAGILVVARDDEDGYRMRLPAYRPEPKPLAKIAAAVGGSPLETLWHDGRYALLVYADPREVRALAPDMAALKALGDVQAIATADGAGSCQARGSTKTPSPGRRTASSPLIGPADWRVTASPPGRRASAVDASAVISMAIRSSFRVAASRR